MKDAHVLGGTQSFSMIINVWDLIDSSSPT